MHAHRGHSRQHGSHMATHGRGVHAPHSMYRPMYRTMYRPMHRPMRHRRPAGVWRSMFWPLWGMGRFSLFLWALLPPLTVIGFVFWRAAFSLAA